MGTSAARIPACSPERPSRASGRKSRRGLAPPPEKGRSEPFFLRERLTFGGSDGDSRRRSGCPVFSGEGEMTEVRSGVFPAVLTLSLLLVACGSTPTVDPGPSFERNEGWSVRRRMRLPAGADVVLEEHLASFTVAEYGASRIRRIDAPRSTPWKAPAGLLIEDAAL